MKSIVLFEDFTNSSIKDKMRDIVVDLSNKYRKGKPFFDALDAKIKDIHNRDILLELVSYCEDEWIASSGEFGEILLDMFKCDMFKCLGVVTFNGKMLTNNIGVESWKPTEFDLKDKEFIYIDDSYFSGGTVKKIDNFMSDYNSSIKSVNVMYDGSEEKLDFVNSFYRYWDYRDIDDYKRLNSQLS